VSPLVLGISISNVEPLAVIHNIDHGSYYIAGAFYYS